MVNAKSAQVVNLGSAGTLAPHFDAADRAIQSNNAVAALWPKRVRVLPKGLRLLPPAVDTDTERIVYDAVVNRQEERIAHGLHVITSANLRKTAPRDLFGVNLSIRQAQDLGTLTEGLNMDKQERLKLAVHLVGGTLGKELFAMPDRHHELVHILKVAYNVIAEIDRVVPEKGPTSLA